MKKGILTFIVLFFSLNFIYANEKRENEVVSQEDFEVMRQWDELEDQIIHDNDYTPEKWDDKIKDYRERLGMFSGELAQSLKKILDRVEVIQRGKKQEMRKPQLRRDISLRFGLDGISSFRYTKAKENWLDSEFNLRLNEDRQPKIDWKALVPNTMSSFWNEYGFKTEYQDFQNNQYSSLALRYNHKHEEELGSTDLEARCGFDVGGRWGDHNYDSAFLLKANLEAKVKLFKYISLELVATPDIESIASGHFDDEWRAELNVNYPLSDKGVFFSGRATEEHNNRNQGIDGLSTVEIGLGLSY